MKFDKVRGGGVQVVDHHTLTEELEYNIRYIHESKLLYENNSLRRLLLFLIIKLNTSF